MEGTFAVTDYVDFSNTLTLEFKMATRCDDDDVDIEGSLVIVEVSNDNGVTWKQVYSVCKQ